MEERLKYLDVPPNQTDRQEVGSPELEEQTWKLKFYLDV